MAKHREPVKPVVPETRSGDEDDGGSSEQESGSEPDQTQFTPSPFSPTSAAAAAARKPRSHSVSDEEESESESESDLLTPSNGARKPRSMIASAGVRDDPEKSSVGARKPRSKHTFASKPDDPGKSSNGARKPRSKPIPAGKRAEDGSEKLLKEVETETPEKTLNKSAKKHHLRVWSEDDVVVILKGMVDYYAEKKADPVADPDSFLHFIKNNLHADVTRRQLQDKIRKLKGKYEIHKKKEKKGREIILPNPYEQMAYELSKSIWGKKDNENGGEKLILGAKTNESVARRPPSKRKGGKGSSPVAKRAKTVEEMVLLTGEELFEIGEGDEEWTKLKIEEMETYLRQLEVKMKQTKLVIDRLKSGGC